MSEFQDLCQRAREVRAWYRHREVGRTGRPWSPEEVALGFMGDVGDLAKLVQAKAGVRPRRDLDPALEHELADCLWSIMVLADEYGIDLESAFKHTMETLEQQLRH